MVSRLAISISISIVAAAACGSRSATAPAVVAPAAVAAVPRRADVEPARPATALVPATAIATHPVRWLPGLAAFADTDRISGNAEDRLGPAPSSCESGATEAQSVAADVIPTEPGDETIVASIAHGVRLYAADGRELARAGIGCGGSADAMIALAVGTADEIGPAIAVLATTGGRAQSTTHVDVFRVQGDDDHPIRVEPLFTAPVEVRDGDQITTGRVELVPGGLIHRRPTGRPTTWLYDPDARALIRSPRLAGVP